MDARCAHIRLIRSQNTAGVRLRRSFNEDALNRTHIVLTGLLVGTSIVMAQNAVAQGNSPTPPTIRVQLPHAIEVSIPQGWVIQDAASNRRRTEQGAAVMNLAELPTGSNGVLLTASPDGNPDRVSVVISVMLRPSASQGAVSGLEGPRLAQVNAQFKEDLETGMRVESATMVRWGGAEKVRLGTLYSLVSRYTYQKQGLGARAMESHRIFLSGGSVGFMLQAPVGEEKNYENTFAAIRNSFRATTIR
jgi:hypothetical protein